MTAAAAVSAGERVPGGANPVPAVFDSDLYRDRAALVPGPEEFPALLDKLGGGLRDGGFAGEGLSASRLAVLPRTTHYDIVSSPTLWRMVAAFLEG